MSKPKRIPDEELPRTGSPLHGKDYRTLLNISPARIAAIDFIPPLSLSQTENELLESLWSASSRCTEASLALAKTKNYHDPRQLIGQSLQDVFPRSPLHDTILRAWIRSGFELACHEIAYPEEDDAVFVEFSVYSELSENQLQRIWIVGTDVSEQRIAWKRLLETEQHYRTLVERPGIILKRVGADRILQYISPDITTLTGYGPQAFYEQVNLFDSLIHADDRQKRQHAMRLVRDNERDVAELEYRLQHKQGNFQWCYERITSRTTSHDALEFTESIILDIQEQKKLEQERSHSQRMETMGALASGIAHDFNNYLAVIIGQLTVQLTRLPQNTDAFEGLKHAEQAAQQCSEMAKQLLNFGRKGTLVKKAIETECFLKESMQLIQHVVPRSIEASLLIDGYLCPVEANSTQLQQVLMNLTVNSRDAMPDGGKLTISARTGMTRLPGNKEATRCLMLTIRDTGPGIPTVDQPHIFDPFFTTKKEHEGTGLGLSTAYSIIHAHGGTIQLDTREPGCCFTIMIPASEQERYDTTTPSQEGTPLLRGNETVLVADDDPMVLSMVASALRSHGYTVLTAEDGKAAITCYEEHVNDIDIALIDHTMPGFSGKQVLTSIARHNPDFPVILTSGHREWNLDISGSHAPSSFLSKPFTIKELTCTLRTILDQQEEKRLANA